VKYENARAAAADVPQGDGGSPELTVSTFGKATQLNMPSMAAVRRAVDGFTSPVNFSCGVLRQNCLISPEPV
jgi:hypothetical protein